MTDADLGSLDTAGERWTLTFTRTYPHPIELVWAAVTEPEHLAAWFPQRVVGERRAGAALRFLTGPDDDGFDGTMVVFDPPRTIEMAWGTDALRIELEPDGAGTRLTLVDTFDELGKAARDAAGWHECLARLAATLPGGPPPDPASMWAAIHPVYVEALGPDASSIGPAAGSRPG